MAESAVERRTRSGDGDAAAAGGAGAGVAARGRRAVLVVALLALSAALPAAAQIVAPAGRTLFNQGVLLRSLLRVDVLDAPAGGDEERVLRHVTAVVWGARPHTSLGLVVPVVRAERPLPGGGERTTTGTGDATLFGRYDVVRRTVPAGYTRLAPEVAVKVPSGGAFGTGSTDLVAGLVFSHVRDPDWWIADLQATFPGTGDGDVRAGERRRFDVAYLRRLLPRGGMGVPMVLGVLELNAEWFDETRSGGAPVAGTGGEVVYLSPGIELLLGRRWVLEASLPIPVHESVGAARPEPRVSAIAGVRWLF